MDSGWEGFFLKAASVRKWTRRCGTISLCVSRRTSRPECLQKRRGIRHSEHSAALIRSKSSVGINSGGRPQNELREIFDTLVGKCAANPSFSAVVVLTFALGIAATVVIFSLAYYGVLLRPLPYSHPEQLVTLGERHLLKGYSRGTSYPDFLDWKTRNTSFVGMDGMTTTFSVLNLPAGAERVVSQRVTGGYFALIGTRPELGRWLVPSDEREGATQVVVISHALWQKCLWFATRSAGITVRLNGEEFTLVVSHAFGIRQHNGRTLRWRRYTAPKFWTPITADAARSSRNAGPLHVVGRLKPGVPIEAAAVEMSTIAARLASEYPADNENFTVRVASMRDDLTADISPELYLLSAAVAFLLLISCLNIANLLLVRSTTRVAELSLRAALGADRWRIVAQLLSESALLSFLGGVLRTALAWTSLQILPVLFPAGDLPWGAATLNWPMLMFSVLISIFAGIGFGLGLPALQASKVDLNEALKSGGNRSFSISWSRLQRGLVVLQVALAFVLLSGATLLHRSLGHLLDVNPGFDATNVLTARTYMAGDNYNSAVKRREFYENLFDRLSKITGVKAAGGVMNLPMCGYRYTWDFDIEGRPKHSRER